MRGYDVAGVGGGGILAIGIAYVKVAPFFRRSRHTHTPLGIAGVDRAAIVNALDDEIARRDYYPDDDGIIAVADLPPAAGAPTDALYVDNDNNVQDASEEEDEDDDDNNANDNDDNDDNDDDSDDDDDNDGL